MLLSLLFHLRQIMKRLSLGSYCIYTGLAVAAGKLNPDYVPNLKLTSPVFTVGPHPSWSDPKKLASIDPFGHVSYIMHVYHII